MNALEYHVKKCTGLVFNKPFTVVSKQMAWGTGKVLLDANNKHVSMVSFNGDAKQRRQQIRALLRAVNGV